MSDVPDVFGLLEEAQEDLRTWRDSFPNLTFPATTKIIERIDAALAMREQYALVPRGALLKAQLAGAYLLKESTLED